MQSRPRTNEGLRRRQCRPPGGAARTVPSPYHRRGQEADLRLVIHDYSGHPGQVHLSRELARRGRHVEHQYRASYTTGRGATERRDGDPVSFIVRTIELGSEFARYSPVVRLRQELQYARMSTRAVLAARPDVTVLSNIPLLSLFILNFVAPDATRAVRLLAVGRLQRKRSGSLPVIDSAGWVVLWAGSRGVLSVRSCAMPRRSSPLATRSSSNSTPGESRAAGYTCCRIGRDRRDALAAARQCLGEGARGRGRVRRDVRTNAWFEARPNP